MKKDEDRVVLRRGMTAHDWETTLTGPDRVEAVGAPSPRVDSPANLSRWMPRLMAGTLAACALILVFALSFRSFEALGSSMEPELTAGDNLLVARIAYGEVDFGLFDWLPLYDSSDLRWGSPGHGDVIVFGSPVSNQRLVKRVIGLPGDTVRITNGRVYVNGQLLDEPYAPAPTACLQICDEVFIQDGHYFVLGDNRDQSVDSRQGWTVARSDVVGKVLFTY